MYPVSKWREFSPFLKNPVFKSSILKWEVQVPLNNIICAYLRCRSNKELELPTITLCSKYSFKNVNSNTSREEILMNLSNHVFNCEDFFHQSFLETLENWNYHEIFHRRLGVCYSLTYKKPLTKKSNGRSRSLLKLLSGNKYQVCT